MTDIQHGGDAVDMVIVPPTRSLGDGFEVRRALPNARRQMVGPFVFFDQMGPTVLQEGRGLDVRPHPHIGLATVTYLLKGALTHRDSLGTLQVIRPGELNWMTAGSGIVHSERSPAEARQGGASLFGLQAWVALPERHEEAAAAFAHHDAAALPLIEGEGARVRVIAGELFGSRSPAATHSDLFYADTELRRGARLELAAEYAERAIYVVEGEITLQGGGQPYGAGQLVVLRAGVKTVIEGISLHPARCMLLGGEPLGPRFVWWNFVSSSRDRILQAKADWEAGKFAGVPGETERIPLPDRPLPERPPAVDYP